MLFLKKILMIPNGYLHTQWIPSRYSVGDIMGKFLKIKKNLSIFLHHAMPFGQRVHYFGNAPALGCYPTLNLQHLEMIKMYLR
jgi:hypothetical protein